MGTFGMQTGDVHTSGVNVQNQSGEFGYARKKIDDTIEFLLSAYPSSDGVQIAEGVRQYNPMLNSMQEKLLAHGDYGVLASKKTVDVNEEITSKIAKNL